MSGPTGSTAASTIAQPVGSQTAPTILSRSTKTIQELYFSEESVKDPGTLQRLLAQAFAVVGQAFSVLSTNPTASCNIVSGLTFTAGQTLYIDHRLGRAYSGWYCVRAQGNPAVLVETPTLPQGVTTAMRIGITSTNAGTYSILFF